MQSRRLCRPEDQSTVEPIAETNGLHVGLIMDGNRRWARARHLPDVAGHHAGVKALRRTVEAAPGAGITTLTVYAFSADNWKRSATEVQALMGLLRRYLKHDIATLLNNGVRLSIIGRRDRLADDMQTLMAEAERATAQGRKLHLRIALDYSGRDAIVAAAQTAAAHGPITADAIEAALANAASAQVDLIMRTSGEQRLSDFLTWEAAYAELLFVDTLWPDFDGAALCDAVATFRARDRRFGGNGDTTANANTHPRADNQAQRHIEPV